MLIDYSRRRYGRTTFTWVQALIDGQWYDLGDPWPCITPKRSEVDRMIETIKSSPHREMYKSSRVATPEELRNENVQHNSHGESRGLSVNHLRD